jgi:flagellar basal body-associated protein FliL
MATSTQSKTCLERMWPRRSKLLALMLMVMMVCPILGFSLSSVWHSMAAVVVDDKATAAESTNSEPGRQLNVLVFGGECHAFCLEYDRSISYCYDRTYKIETNLVPIFH